MSSPSALVRLFEESGYPLARTLTEMLENHPAHCTERRGCGLSQATRYLATLINLPRDPCSAKDLSLFEDWPENLTESYARYRVNAGRPLGWRDASRIDAGQDAHATFGPISERLNGLLTLIETGLAQLDREEDRMVLALISDLIRGRVGDSAPSLPQMNQKPDIGSCSQAEEYFLEIAHGRVRRGGWINILVDSSGHPFLVEKMNLGESHSALALEEVRIGNVRIPPGGLFALKHTPDAKPTSAVRCGHVFDIAAVSEARFLRLTTLSVPPEIRHRAFGAQVETQVRLGLLSPLSTRLGQLREFIAKLLSTAQ